MVAENEDIILEVSAFFLFFSRATSSFAVVRVLQGILGGRACRGAEGAGEAPAGRPQTMDEARAWTTHPPTYA